MSAIKYHGGKTYLAKKIIELMPPHIHYVEPYFGGGAVLFEKDCEGISEVVNDIDGELTNFWKVLQSENSFYMFKRLVEAIPFSEVEFDDSQESSLIVEGYNENILRAATFFVRCRQSLAARMKSFTSITKTRTRRNMNGEVSAWLTAIEGLSQVHSRLKRVLILNREALDVIKQQDGEQTLYYIDPPYLSQVRVAKNVYSYEMNEEQHCSLLKLITEIKGSTIVSGYDSELYNDYLKNWSKHTFDLANHASGGNSKRRMIECLWIKNANKKTNVARV